MAQKEYKRRHDNVARATWLGRSIRIWQESVRLSPMKGGMAMSLIKCA